jgi:hypothetical protein
LSAAIRYDVENNQLNLAYPSMTLAPNSTWSWGVGYRYVRQDPVLQPVGANQVASTFYLRLNEDWGMRFYHQYNLQTHLMSEQFYTIYRDFRSLTIAVTFRIQESLGESPNYGAALTFSFKSFPRFKLGDDSNRHTLLLGG